MNSWSDTFIRLLKSPLWIAQLFTGAKSFIDNPILGSAWLNKSGLHIIRLLTAHGIMRLRMAVLGWGIPKADRQSFQSRGYILKENFLTESDFLALEAEIRACRETPRRSAQGDTITEKTLLTPARLENLPHTAELLANKQLRRLLRYSNAHRRLPFFNIECIRNGANDSDQHDPQKDLHSDTFHPTMKFWFYLDDVDEHNGPFTYVPGSNRLSKQRLRWEYQMSQRAHQHPNRLVGRGSFRFTADDRAELGLPPPRAFTVPKNTLLIANTFGIHGRGSADAGSRRLSIWGMNRTNPFSPFPGFGLEYVNRFQYQVLEWLQTRGR